MESRTSTGSQFKLNAQELQEVSPWIGRIAGVALLGFGVLITALLAFLISKSLDNLWPPDNALLVGVGILAPIALFCDLVGYRLAMNRPNLHGSILSPVGWYVVAAVFGAMFSYFVYFVLAKASDLGVGCTVFLGVLAGKCYANGKRLEKHVHDNRGSARR